MAHADISAKGILEARDEFAARRNPCRVETLVYIFLFVAPQRGLIDGYQERILAQQLQEILAILVLAHAMPQLFQLFIVNEAHAPRYLFRA